MSVKNSEETDLRPFYVQMGLAFWFEDVKNYRHSIFVVLSNNALVCVSSIRFDHTTLLLRRFSWLVILQQQRFWVQHWRVFPEQ